MVDPTRQSAQNLGDPQEQPKPDVVGRLRNAIQVVFNCYDDLMKEMNRELYTLQKYRARLMEDKSDPLISQAKIQKKIEENQAEIKPLIAEAEILKNICEEFAQDVELLCDKTAVRFKTSGKEPKKSSNEVISLNKQHFASVINFMSVRRTIPTSRRVNSWSWLQKSRDWNATTTDWPES